VPQSNAIFGFLLAAFIIFIVQRGELPTYLGFILATPQQPPAQNASVAPTAIAAATG